MRIPEADRVKLLERPRNTDPGIVQGYVVLLCPAAHGLALDGLADRAAPLVHVDPDHAAEEILVDLLRTVQ